MAIITMYLCQMLWKVECFVWYIRNFNLALFCLPTTILLECYTVPVFSHSKHNCHHFTKLLYQWRFILWSVDEGLSFFLSYVSFLWSEETKVTIVTASDYIRKNQPHAHTCTFECTWVTDRVFTSAYFFISCLIWLYCIIWIFGDNLIWQINLFWVIGRLYIGEHYCNLHWVIKRKFSGI